MCIRDSHLGELLGIGLNKYYRRKNKSPDDIKRLVVEEIEKYSLRQRINALYAKDYDLLDYSPE